MPDQVDSAKVLAEFASGATIVLQGLHRLWPPLIDFVRSMVDDLGHPVQANAYITPPGSRGFDPHYDVHDVFVLQAAGEKRWTVHDPCTSTRWPRNRGPSTATPITARIADEPVIDTVLSPGDALYLPRGWVHSARSLDTTSIHLTIGVSALTHLDVVRAVVDTLAVVERVQEVAADGHRCRPTTTKWRRQQARSMARIDRCRARSCRRPQRRGGRAAARASR